MAMAALMIAWQHIPTDGRSTDTTGRRITEANDIARPAATVVEPEAELQVWHEDGNMLNYRAPLRPR